MGVYLQKKYNIPLVGIEHAARFNLDKLDAYTHYWGSYAYSNADGIITVSQSLKQRILYHFNKQSTTINNLVHPIFFSKLCYHSKMQIFILFQLEVLCIERVLIY